MKKTVGVLLAVCLLLSGCSSLFSGSYAKVEPHTEPSNQQNKPVVTVSCYEQMRHALVSVIESGGDSVLLSVNYPLEEVVRTDMNKAIDEICRTNPYAAYAVSDIRYDLGANGSSKAVSVQISYLPNRILANRIQKVENAEQIRKIVQKQMDECAANVVLYTQSKISVDYEQMVADYAIQYPQKVMEAPAVTVQRCPENADKQIVELRFSYRTSREELRTMQNKVTPVFASAEQHVAGKRTDKEKAERLYSFLMNRYEYDLQTSITPAYSLLLHGVGDCNAFAVVYAAMCRQANVNCQIVTGTRNDEPWVWNVMEIEGVFYHLDMLRCSEEGEFRLRTKDEMKNYVWDYTAYPSTAREKS
ncbi:MAG: transglutaminase domain-containing protein [Ruminococcaceae bacterium]|nr:transglutaminase domain-containing protein [Oscillospiraceae bacterium]